MDFKAFLALMRRAGGLWIASDPLRLAAALSFFTIFSFVPLLLIFISVAGLVAEPGVAREALLSFLAERIGSPSAAVVARSLADIQQTGHGLAGISLGSLVLALAALGGVQELRHGFNTVWGGGEEKLTVRHFFHESVISFIFILLLGVFFLISLGLSGLGKFTTSLSEGGGELALVGMFGNTILPLLFGSFVCAILFRYLPSMWVPWGAAFKGGLVTALLFTIGSVVVDWYVRESTVLSLYGAAGSLLALLTWIYASGLALYFGAAVTRVLCNECERQTPFSSPLVSGLKSKAQELIQ